MYQQPRTEVVDLHVTNQLLAGSTNVDATRDGFTSGGTDTWGTSGSRIDDYTLEDLINGGI